jgi:3-hydroxybutyryl-CoA dehydrogenase
MSSLKDVDMVVEAATENTDLKLKIFKQLDQIIVNPNAILGSNTSSISITKIASATKRPHQV